MPFDPSQPFDVLGEEKQTPPPKSVPTAFDPSKPFDVVPEEPETPTTFGGVAGRYAAGVDSKLIANTMSQITGIPTDLANAVITNPMDPKWKLMSNPLPADWWNQQLAKVGIGTLAAPARNAAERVAQAAGETTGSVLQTLLPAKAGVARAAVTESAAAPLTEVLGAGSIPANVGIAGAAGAAGEGAAEIAPPELKPAARSLGELAGGVGAAAVPAVASGAIHAGQGALHSIPPIGTEARSQAAQEAAVRALESQSSDPNAAFNALADRIDTNKQEIIQGSQPTTAELANDPGLLGLQRVRQRQSPEFGAAITERQIANNQARIQAMQDMVSPNASPEATQNFLREHLKSIDLAGEQAADTARQEATTAREAIAPTMTPEEQGAQARAAIDETRAPAEAELRSQQAAQEQQTAGALEGIGGQEALGTPEQRQTAVTSLGESMRSATQAAYDAERSKLSELREAIDPTGTMGMSPNAIKTARENILGTFLPESGTSFSGVENNFYNTVQNWPDLIPLEQALQLRANINGRLKNVIDHSPQEEKRLMMLKSGIDDALADTTAHVSATEAAAQPSQTQATGTGGIASRLIGVALPDLEPVELGPKFASEVSQAYAANPRATRAAEQDPVARALINQAPEAAIPTGESGVVTPIGERGAGTGEPARIAGDQGVPGGPTGRTGPTEALGVPEKGALEPLSPEARDRFAEWNQSYADMARTYRGETAGKLHDVGKILQRGGAYDSYKLTDQEVPWAIVRKGPTAGEAVDRFLAATPEEAHGALDDAFGFSLRSAAQNPETQALNLTAYRRWIKDHEAALSRRPGLLDQFDTAAKAQQRLNDINQSLDEHAASYPLRPGLGDAAVLPQFWKPGPQGLEKMQEFFRAAGSGENAVNSAVDHATFSFANDVVRNGEIDPKRATEWLRRYDRALEVLPGLKEKFANAAESQELVDQTIGLHLQARNDFTRSVAGAFIQDDPDRAIGRVFSGNDRTQKAADLMDRVSGDQAATEGVQRAAIDHILSRFSGNPISGAEEGALTPARLRTFISDNRQVLDKIFPNGGAKTFDALAEDLERSQRVEGAKQPGGSDTKELLERGKPFEVKDHGTSSSIIWALLAEHAGHSMIGGVGGPAAATAGLVTRSFLKGKANALKLETAQVMDQMLLDPELALQMRKLYPPKGAEPSQTAINMFGKRIIQQAITAAQGEDISTAPPKAVAPIPATAQASAKIPPAPQATAQIPQPRETDFPAYHGTSVDAAAKHFADFAQRLVRTMKTSSEKQAEMEAAATP